VKGIADLWRTDKVVRNARDAFVTEHMEIAAYEVLEQVGDTQTAEVAREIRAEEEAMAERIASK
jgi:ferritin-like metal-binding protein YciE